MQRELARALYATSRIHSFISGQTVAKWFIPVNVVLASLVGCTIGYVVALIVKPPPQYFNFTGNIGNIPLVIIGAICHDSSNPFGNADTCNSNGVAYMSFGQRVGAVTVYTFVYQMLAPPEVTQ